MFPTLKTLKTLYIFVVLVSIIVGLHRCHISEIPLSTALIATLTDKSYRILSTIL